MISAAGAPALPPIPDTREDTPAPLSSLPDSDPGTPLPPNRTPGPGDTLDLVECEGRFDVLGELGRGGMGVVFRAIDRASGREVALKVLKESLSAQRLLRFKREGELTARLSHPGIVRIHSMGMLGGKPYLAYELVDGATTLTSAFAKLPPAERARLVLEAARALGHAHEQGVVHRDVKPDNVLLDRQGRVHVADFGLAAAQDVERLTLSGVMVGTPTFMAPEQLEARHAEVGPHSDVWSLGVMLYLALTGEHPFNADTLYQLIDLVSRHDPLPPRKHDATIPRPLEAVCLRALSRQVARRHADAHELADELEQALAGKAPARRLSGLVATPGPRTIAVLCSAALVLSALIAVAVVVGAGGTRVTWDPELPAAWGGERPLQLSGRIAGDLEGVRLSIGGGDAPLGPDGRFTVDLLLPDGPAEVIAIASRGEAELSRAVHAVVIDRTPPEVSWSALSEPSVGEGGRLTGSIRDQAEWVELVVDGHPAHRGPPGSFALERRLRVGPNPVQVVAKDAWGNATASIEQVLWRVPTWWPELEEEARPPLPLPPGLTFGDQPAEYLCARDGSILVWVRPPHKDEHTGKRLLMDGDAIHLLDSGLFMGKHEVTWAQWERFCRESGRTPRRPAFKVDPDHPVHHVTWAEAVSYCEWAGLRLPTETEWELAARGPFGPAYPWGDQPLGAAELARRGNFLDEPGHPDGWEYTAPVGEYPAGRSPSGCLDMAGNVFEWVQDWYGPTPTQDTPLVGWAGPPTGKKRVLKGGGFDQPVKLCGVGRRYADEPERALPHTGFRVARSAD